MRIRHFLNQIEHSRVHQAIQAAEKGTSGRVVVYISHRRIKDALDEANRVFRKLRMESAGQKAGLLLFLAPKTQQLAVLGGTALHAKLGQAWWDLLVQDMKKHFAREQYTAGLVHALEEVSQALKAHFPGDHLPSGEKDLIEE